MKCTYLQITAFFQAFNLRYSVLHAKVDDFGIVLDFQPGAAHIGIGNWRFVSFLLFDVFFPLAIFIHDLTNPLNHLFLLGLFSFFDLLIWIFHI